MGGRFLSKLRALILRSEKFGVVKVRTLHKMLTPVLCDVIVERVGTHIDPRVVLLVSMAVEAGGSLEVENPLENISSEVRDSVDIIAGVLIDIPDLVGAG
jgi:uncharacterized protein YciU (UPF0263 family)